MATNNDIVKEAVESIRQRISLNIDSEGLRASGRTQQSMRVEETDTGARLLGRQYFNSLEEGRPGGPVPRNFREIIEQWIYDKGINVTPVPYKTNRPHKYTEQERSVKMAAGAIAHTIQVSGTTLYRNGGSETVYTPAIQDELEELKQKLAILVKKQIENTLHKSNS